MNIDTEALAQFEKHGYAIGHGVLDIDADLEPVRDEYGALVDELATRWHQEGRLRSAWTDLPFEERFTRILAEANLPSIRYFDITLGKSNITDDSPVHLGPAVFRLLRSPRLLDVIESFIGGEIYSNPIQHVRIKPPEDRVPLNRRNALTAATPWHQDMGVAMPEADRSDVLTVWIPVTQATEESGCLLVVPGSHKGELMPHCRNVAGTQMQTAPHIRERLIDLGRVVPVPMRPGDVLFLHKKTIHGSLPNVSDRIRWSFDFRYNPIGQPTGRSEFPGFVVRSRSCPEQELTDPDAWAALWQQVRRRLATQPRPEFHRWDLVDPLCA